MKADVHVNLPSMTDPEYPRLGGVPTFEFRATTHYYRPQGKVMYSQASVILFTIGHIVTRSLLILVGYSVTAHPCCGVAGTHSTGMLSCLTRFLPKTA